MGGGCGMSALGSKLVIQTETLPRANMKLPPVASFAKPHGYGPKQASPHDLLKTAR
jgi:hypothetical protein